MGGHIKYIKAKCSSRLNFFRCLTNSECGVDHSTLQQLYNTYQVWHTDGRAHLSSRWNSPHRAVSASDNRHLSGSPITTPHRPTGTSGAPASTCHWTGTPGASSLPLPSSPRRRSIGCLIGGYTALRRAPFKQPLAGSTQHTN